MLAWNAIGSKSFLEGFPHPSRNLESLAHAIQEFDQWVANNKAPGFLESDGDLHPLADVDRVLLLLLL